MIEPDHIRVLHVDAHAMLRCGLMAFLADFDDLLIVGEASNGADALHACAQLRPDVVLMDVVLPDMDGTLATALLRKQFPHAQVMILTSFAETTAVQQVIQAGALSYLLKSIEADDLANAIRAAHHGKPTLAPEAMRALIHSTSHPPFIRGGLTTRERDVLALLVKGLSNTEIAERLVVSHSTIKGHVSNILAKLGAHSRTTAVALAMQYHLVDSRAEHPLAERYATSPMLGRA